jgi:hypothetical protein
MADKDKERKGQSGPLTAEERREQASEEGAKLDVEGQGTPTQEAPGDFEKAPTTEEQRAKGEALQRKMDEEAAESDEPQAPPLPNLTIPIPDNHPENPPQPPPVERLSDEELEEQAFYTDEDATEEDKDKEKVKS